MQGSEAFRTSPSGNINDWAKALEPFNPELAAQLNEKRSEGFDRIQELNLPRYQTATLSLSDFLTSPDPTISNLQSELFYISLVPHKDLPRFSKAGLAADQILDFIQRKVDPQHTPDYEIVVQQYFENKYGGTMVINPSGQIYIEFREGTQGPISRGAEVPELVAFNDTFTGVMRYTFEDKILRTNIYQTLQSVPHEGFGRETKYLSGYYEFVLVESAEGGPLRPIFIDYKDNPLFHLPDYQHDLE